jgi:hypothetical protein
MVSRISKLSLTTLILIITILSISPSFGKPKVRYAPIATSIEPGTPVGDNDGRTYRAWNTKEQQLLFKRTTQAKRLIPRSLFTTPLDFLYYRNTPEHDQLKQKLSALLDNKTAWPEYIYIARLVDSGTTYTYQVVCSTSDIIEKGTLQPIEINPNMQLALQQKRAIVTDLFSPFQGETPTHAAVYYPIYSKRNPISFLVFVKGYWRERKITLEERINILEQKVGSLEWQLQRLQEKQPVAPPPCEFEGLTPK